MESDIKEFVRHFLERERLAGTGIAILPLKGGGSRRSFWRVKVDSGEPASIVVMANSPVERSIELENYAYLMIGRHLKSKMLPVPEFYSYNLDRGYFILEDMGDQDLQEVAGSEPDPAPLYKAVLEQLFRFQVEGAEDFDPGWCYQTARYDRKVMRKYEAEYFKEAFLKGYLGLKGQWSELEGPFEYTAEMASKADNNFFMHRDFQSTNIMVRKGKIGVVDWQGARFGPLGYDVASILIDPYVDLPEMTRDALWEDYLVCVKSYSPHKEENLKRYYPYIAIQRNLQILGAFGYLSRVLKKDHFRAYIPAALRNLHRLLRRTRDPRLSPLKDLAGHILFEKDLDMEGLRS